MNLGKKIIRNLDEVISGAFLVLVIGLIVVNVILRYFFNFILNWAEELATLSFVWCVFVGAASAYKTNQHVAIDVLVNLLPKPIRKIMEILIDLFVFVLCLGVTYLSVIIVMNSANKPTPILKLPYSYVNFSMTVGFGLMAVYAGVHLVNKFKYTKKLEKTEINEINPL